MPLIQCGYYIKARCIKDSWIANAAPVVREVWDYLLREANHVDKKYNGFVIQRGQIFRSYRDIRDALLWMVGARKVRYSENQMKHTMKLLRVNHMIELVSQPRGNLITILNYDKFQDPKNYESTDESTNESTSDQPRINQSSTAINKNVKNKEIKNKEIKNKEKSFSPPSIDEVKIYFSDNGYSEYSAIKAFNYYSTADWKDARGNQVKNWKQKMISVWFKEENRVNGNNNHNKINGRSEQNKQACANFIKSMMEEPDYEEQ